MMRRWAVLGVLLGVAAGVLFGAPASWLAWSLARATDNRVQMQAAAGTVWHGHAQLVLSDGAERASAVALPGLLAWQLDAGSSGLTIHLRSACCIDGALMVELAPSPGALQVRMGDAASRWPAGLLTGLGAPWNTVGLQGLLGLQTQGLSVEWSGGHWTWEGAARIDATGMSSRLSTLQPLGDYRLRLDAPVKGGTPAIALETLSGSLLLSGTGQWSGSQWRFRGEARAEPPSEEALSNLLNIMGRRDGLRSVISLG